MYRCQQRRSALAKAEALLSCFIGTVTPMSLQDLYQAGARTHREVQFPFEFRDPLEAGRLCNEMAARSASVAKIRTRHDKRRR